MMIKNDTVEFHLCINKWRYIYYNYLWFIRKLLLFYLQYKHNLKYLWFVWNIVINEKRIKR